MWNHRTSLLYRYPAGPLQPEQQQQNERERPLFDLPLLDLLPHQIPSVVTPLQTIPPLPPPCFFRFQIPQL